MENYRLSHLEALEAESIHILREVAAEFENPVMLYSVGKDSSVLVRLAQKAFAPGPIPFPLLHVDTSFKFPEMYVLRDQLCKDLGINLLVERNETSIAAGANPFELGTWECCAQLKTGALLGALKNGGYDAAIGGARRDEERSRAKERVYSFRDERGQWDPKNQRPEIWNLYNGRLRPGESIRVFPISNWTELDVWSYIDKEQIPIVPLYFAAVREVIVQGDRIIPITPGGVKSAGVGQVKKVMCRYRTLGCMPCTGAVESTATTVREIIDEMLLFNESERAGRVIDYDADGSMEQKKQEGYF